MTMTYERSEIIEYAVKAIEEYGLISLNELISYIPIKKSQFFNAKYNEEEQIIDALNDSKIKTKVKRRKEWANSENSTLQIALYKLCATPDELKRLGTQYNVVSGDSEEAPVKVDIDINKLSKDELRAMDAIITKATTNQIEVSE